MARLFGKRGAWSADAAVRRAAELSGMEAS